jgi:hypothetical protein
LLVFAQLLGVGLEEAFYRFEAYFLARFFGLGGERILLFLGILLLGGSGFAFKDGFNAVARSTPARGSRGRGGIRSLTSGSFLWGGLAFPFWLLGGGGFFGSLIFSGGACFFFRLLVWFRSLAWQGRLRSRRRTWRGVL